MSDEEVKKKKESDEAKSNTSATTDSAVVDKTNEDDKPRTDETLSSKSEAPKPRAKKKKVKRSVPKVHVHVMASFNNTIITITDQAGGALTNASAGASGFRGSKKGTAYAAQVAAEKAISTAKQQFGTGKADVFIKGVGLGREAAVRALSAADIVVESISDVTGTPHGGCRPKKARRV